MANRIVVLRDSVVEQIWATDERLRNADLRQSVHYLDWLGDRGDELQLTHARLDLPWHAVRQRKNGDIRAIGPSFSRNKPPITTYYRRP